MNEVYGLSAQDIFKYQPYRAPDRVRPEPDANSTIDTTNEPTDFVEFSGSALAISREKAIESASARADRLVRIRQMIENNTYETPEKISATAGRLVEVLELA